MTDWQPRPYELQQVLLEPPSAALDLAAYGKGIDNIRIDVHLSPRLRDLGERLVRDLIYEDLGNLANGFAPQLVSAADLARLRECWGAPFEALLARSPSATTVELLTLHQLAALRWLLELVPRVDHQLQRECWQETQPTPPAAPDLDQAERLELLQTREREINQRVTSLLMRQVRRHESGHLLGLRSAVIGEAWPLPEQTLFNPLLPVPRLDQPGALTQDYPIMALMDLGASRWLSAANRALVTVFGDYLPSWAKGATRADRLRRAGEAPPGGRPATLTEDGLAASARLLSRFVPAGEYRHGLMSWLDEPENLRWLLRVPGQDGAADPMDAETSGATWTGFRLRRRRRLHRYLARCNLVTPIVLLYWLPTLRGQLGGRAPLGMLCRCLAGELDANALAAALSREGVAPAPAAVDGVLRRISNVLGRMDADDRGLYLDRFLVDFLTLRRDLKLAHKTWEAMAALRLLEDPDEIVLSRANGTLYELLGADEPGPVPQRIRAHAIVKADVRGSTRITEALAARGLNPASHFSLNLFDPVNRLLAEFGAEKLFVEGDAVILVVYALEADGSAAPVARACALAQRILAAVAKQNRHNRAHDLPELELGLGVAFSPRAPNWLYDDGRRILISAAINVADRLSSCAARLRAAGVAPPDPRLRVLQVRHLVPPPAEREFDPAETEELLAFNVNGVRLDEPTFFELQRELPMQQTRLATDAGIDDENATYFVGRWLDQHGQGWPLAVRSAPIRDWDGQQLGGPDPQGRRSFELIADPEILDLLWERGMQLEV